jgi:hypothetical protein
MFSVGKITKYWLILFKIEVKKNISFDPMTLQHVVEFVIHAFFLDEKVLLLPVVYEKSEF